MPAALFCRNIGVRLKYPPVVFLVNANNTQASVENIEYIAERHLDREQLLRLASCSYI